jgi:hypothetical protein
MVRTGFISLRTGPVKGMGLSSYTTDSLSISFSVMKACERGPSDIIGYGGRVGLRAGLDAALAGNGTPIPRPSSP